MTFTNTLLQWYAVHRRELPWRDTKDPYRIWISEIILQQTRVAQGYDYFLRFMHRFPTVEALAEAEEEEVMKMWQGLGYYSRARNLHAAARSIHGAFPDTYPSVRALKGVGDYTAAAICSFAYDMPYAVVDGNVYRVLSRYFGIDLPIDSTQGKREFARLAQELIDPKRPADYNQAIMDFGALQCVPQSPLCLECPLADSCAACAQGRVETLPVKQHKVKSVTRYFNYLLVRCGDGILLRRRGAGDIWQGLYEFPLVETPGEITLEELLSLPAFQSFMAPGEQPVVRSLCGGVKHVLTHRTLMVNLYEVKLSHPTASFEGFLKVGPDEVEQYAVSRLIHQFLEKYL